MRINNNVLLENVNDYLQHIGVVPKQIDKVQHSLKKDMEKSDEKDIDYAEYRHKSHAEILQIIERNLVIINYNPIIFYTLNFLLFAYLFDKKLVQFSALTGLYIFYFVFILSISIVIYLTIKKRSYLYPNRKLMITNISIFSVGLLLCILKIFNITLGIFVVPITVIQFIFIIGIFLLVLSAFLRKLELTATGLLVIQKSISAITPNETVFMIVTFGSWLIILLITLYFVVQYSTSKYI
ncbi:hypothetical protein [Mammaliicoccus stepanovicii]|uniref:Uncharacterized protein n=1 Tax=Mammaliicoccus stepanovicii TaxID=643214 RepID=A0A240A798_9STAP|nr:hypothetical protein [Mammaliicoccus stepanovicii]PNZ77182.1 hypothetical protein CD111_05190 [Mammaliicoccus stepanovicii]GGI39635.1 hypothetical protein GCM10010896_04370 [Mammaliicoccus stepanovicii]SNV79159.1 Uncharacterised protein [Mammaliicoccus stepanovicii]